MIVDLIKQHALFSDVNIKAKQTRLIVDNDNKVIILNCKAMYYKAGIDVTDQFMVKNINLIADNTTTQTTDNGEVGMYDFLSAYMDQPKAINELISYYVIKNKEQF